MSIPNIYLLAYKKGIGIKELSDRTGVSVDSLIDWVIHKKLPSFAEVERVAKVLDCKADFLSDKSNKSKTGGSNNV